MAAHQLDRQTVTIIRTMPVYPKPLSPRSHQKETPHLLHLSNLDRKCPILIYLVFFYKPSQPHQNPSTGFLSQSLKSSLEKVLSVWYPAAGRLVSSPVNQRIDLACNNAGAILVEAFTQVKMSEVGDLSQYNRFFEKLVFRPAFNGNFSEMPLVVAQVTTFGCGGYTLGVGISHSLFDGQATFNFLSAWAATAAGRVGDGTTDEELLFSPVHERGRLLVGKNHDNYQPTLMTRVPAFDHLLQLIEQQAASPPSSCVDPADSKKRVEGGGWKFSEVGPTAGQEDWVLMTFHVTAAMIGNLKRKVNGDSRINACSSFEVVAAHLWKARTKALAVRKERKVCLQFTVDTRNKLSPPLPKGFTGNAYVLASISCSAGELEEDTLEATVLKVKEAKQAVNNSYVRAYLEALEAPQRSLPTIKELTIVSDWTRTPFHTIDFLGHGNGNDAALYASPLASPLPQTAYFMQNPNEAGAIDVRIGLHPRCLHAFQYYFLTI